ncbi:MAG TPA: substrate-binding domain-containing protein [Nakamurella sp.]
MTSRHGSGSGGARIAPWIIVTIVVGLVLAGAVTAYLLITRDSKNTVACSSQVVLQLVAAPGAAPGIDAAAAAFDTTNPVARSACVTTDVTTAPGAQTASDLAGGWIAQPSPGPAVWFPDSAADLATLEAADSAMTAGRNPAPMAGSPVVLAVRTDDAAALTAASLQWKDLPAAAGPNGSVTLADGRKLILALPDPTTNRATSYALQSVLAGSTSTTGVDASLVAANAAPLAGLDDGGPARQPASTLDALQDLASGGAGFAAVPIVAAEFEQLAQQNPGLGVVALGGSTAGDQIYGVPITASWVDPTMDDAASAFLAYLRGTAGQQILTENGLKVAPDTGVQLADGGAAVATALAAAIGAPTDDASTSGSEPSGAQPTGAEASTTDPASTAPTG